MRSNGLVTFRDDSHGPEEPDHLVRHAVDGHQVEAFVVTPPIPRHKGTSSDGPGYSRGARARHAANLPIRGRVDLEQRGAVRTGLL
jgi:hypothetical protein